MLSVIEREEKVELFGIIAIFRNSDGIIKKNAPIKTRFNSAEQFVIVQNGKAIGLFDGNGKTVSKKYMPNLECGLLSSKVKNTEVYWAKQVQDEFATIKFQTKDVAGGRVFGTWKMKFSVSIDDADVWYKNFIVAPALKDKAQIGIIYTMDMMKKLIEGFAQKAGEYAFTQVEAPSEAVIKWKKNWPQSYEFDKWLDNPNYTHEVFVYHRKICAIMKDYLVKEFKSIGFKLKIVNA